MSAEALARYEAAVGGPGPLFAFVAAWEELVGCVGGAVEGPVVHVAQDTRLHRLLRPGDQVRTRAWVEERRGPVVVVGAASQLASGRPVAEHRVTLLAPLAGGRPLVGDQPAPAPAEPLVAAELAIPPDLPRRYAEASGDHNPIHLDPDAARRAGFPGPVLHGMCTLALVCGVAVERVCGGEPELLRRVAARFSRPVLPGDLLRVTIHRTRERGTFAFSAETGRGPALRHGILEVGGPPRA